MKSKLCPWCKGRREWLKRIKLWKCKKCGKEIKDYKFTNIK